MTAENAYALIMAGGKGERFWPLSTARRPKQLLALTGGQPLIVQAVERLKGVVPSERIVVVTNAALVEPIRALLGEGSPVGVLGEPVGRDTAAAIAAGAAWIKRRDPNAVFAVLTADHIIGDLPVFRETLTQGMALCAEQDVLLTIGIEPTEPSSAYGYIEAGDAWETNGQRGYFHVRRFVEKPDRQTAKSYLQSGRYAWNSGMFIWSIRSIQAAFAAFQPALAKRIDAWATCETDAALEAALERDFPALCKISIDYAVMEKATNIVICKGRFAWDDVGSWPALKAHLPTDGQGNAIQGDCAVVDSGDNIVVSEGRLTALVGVRDLIVVQADGVTLVCDKAHAQEIKALVAQLRQQSERESIL
ncbi:MAG: sugar phosphate nucleotidyltransferase [Kiritimatiellae bacterium]|jgi:mannose-1-phosphate guanylyltransferase|nr:sugar phosphate nucleotidyltransferase [Kiritimatiellia bacterium]MDY0150260.1 sugar phosphate nucleotidyltransferase [Kiritimatiellia bacterium]